jgi:septal ring factor EnvC (AmiA/AmiB activator)
LIPVSDRARGVVDVDSVLLSVQERDKWRRRMELLERSLGEVRERRRRLEARLRRIKKELSRLRITAEAVLDLTRTALPAEVPNAPRSTPIR